MFVRLECIASSFVACNICVKYSKKQCCRVIIKVKLLIGKTGFGCNLLRHENFLVLHQTVM